MKKFLSIFLTAISLLAFNGVALAKVKYVMPKAPVVTPTLKPCIEKYRQGNYTGAMVDLEELTKKEKTNIYAKYYLDLCYTKLGYEKEAKDAYKEIIENNTNESLTYYSKKAVACIEDPESETCGANLSTKVVKPGEEEDADDMTKFIYSGRKIHPAAMDNIIKQRMEIKLQQDEYRNRQNEQMGPLSYSRPSNEEIAFALDTLAKIGINPFGQGNNVLSDTEYSYINNYNFPLNYGNNNSSIEQMLLYSQLGQQNNFMNYGI